MTTVTLESKTKELESVANIFKNELNSLDKNPRLLNSLEHFSLNTMNLKVPVTGPTGVVGRPRQPWAPIIKFIEDPNATEPSVKVDSSVSGFEMVDGKLVIGTKPNIIVTLPVYEKQTA